MYYEVKFDIYSFEFWSGAKDRVRKIEEMGLMRDLEALIVDVFSDSESVSDTDINDFVWFEDDMINDYLGIGEAWNLKRSDRG